MDRRKGFSASAIHIDALKLSHGDDARRGCSVPDTDMPIYTFKLRDDCGEDTASALNLPNAEIAYCYACDVVGELMDHREELTRYWRLDVYRNNGEKIYDILFADLDPTLDHLRPEIRALVKLNSQRIRSLRDALHEAATTRREAQALAARSRGKPHLATDHGRNVIR